MKRRDLSLNILLFVALSFTKIVCAEQINEVPQFVMNFLDPQTTGLKLSIGRHYGTSFESLSEFSGFYIVPPNHMGTATQELSSEQVHSGSSAHKAFIYDENSQSSSENHNHRAYPTFKFEKTPIGILKDAVLVEFWVWDDIPLYHKEDASWISLATFTSYNDDFWYKVYLINVDEKNHIHLMHVPQHGEAIHDIFQTETISLPTRTWVKISAYIDYTKNNRFESPFISVWQDGQLVSAARFEYRVSLSLALSLPNKPKCLDGLSVNPTIEEAEDLCNLKFTGGLAQAHFGLYAPPLLSSGVIYNDDVSVVEILRQ